MTCIVGLIDKDNKKIYVGGDSAGVANYYITIRKDPKVFVRKPFIFGFTSSFRMGQILMCGNLKIKQQEKEEDTFMFMVNKFIPAIKKLYKTEGYLMTYKEGGDKGGTFIVGYKGRLFEIENDFQVAENLINFGSVGCGSDLALGSMYATAFTKIPSEKRIVLALEAAAKFSAGVKEPFLVKSINIKK